MKKIKLFCKNSYDYFCFVTGIIIVALLFGSGTTFVSLFSMIIFRDIFHVINIIVAGLLFAFVILFFVLANYCWDKEVVEPWNKIHKKEIYNSGFWFFEKEKLFHDMFFLLGKYIIFNLAGFLANMHLVFYMEISVSGVLFCLSVYLLVFVVLFFIDYFSLYLRFILLSCKADFCI